MNEKNVEDWIAFFNDEIDKSKKLLVSVFELRQIIEKIFQHDDCPLSGLRIDIEQSENIVFSLGEYGQLDDSSPTIETLGTAACRFSLKSTIKDNWQMSTLSLLILFKDLIIASWLPMLRVANMGLIKHSEAEVINRWRALSNLPGPYFVIFIDLDKFKALNDALTHIGGDLALEYVTSCLLNISSDRNILCFRTGGDEFQLLFSGQTEVEILPVLYELEKAIKSKSFPKESTGESFDLGVTYGVSKIEKQLLHLYYIEALKAAEKCTRYSDNSKKRGIVSFSYSNVIEYDNSVVTLEKLKISSFFVKENQNIQSPFANNFLNLLSEEIFRSEWTSYKCIISSVEKISKWVDLKILDGFSSDELFGKDNWNINVTKGAIIFAIAHGIWRSNHDNHQNLELRLNYNSDFSKLGLYIQDYKIYGDDVADITHVIGVPIKANCNYSLKDQKFSNAILLKIGNQSHIEINGQAILDAALFSDVVVVDDRPKTGGGLPDFWQAAIAHIIDSMVKNPNITRIFVFGDVSNGSETVLRLKDPLLIDQYELSTTIAKPIELIRKALEMLQKEETVCIVNDSKEIANELYKGLFNVETWLPSPILETDEGVRNEFLKRDISISQQRKLKLKMVHGVACSSASEAYPIVLNILRDHDQSIVYDDAFQKLAEVVGFKLILNNPSTGMIPYYWNGESEGLDLYTSRVLLDDDSLIGSIFKNDGQKAAFVNHLYKYCKNLEGKRSTRRAILTVPNVLNSDNELNPLGLVSVWATPYFNDTGCTIDFCFVWRTVEALVGLPYSLYGSIRLAQNLIDEIKRTLIESRCDHSISLGNVTYLALSLHMRVDDYHKRIAKSIVDASSI